MNIIEAHSWFYGERIAILKDIGYKLDEIDQYERLRNKLIKANESESKIKDTEKSIKLLKKEYREMFQLAENYYAALEALRFLMVFRKDISLMHVDKFMTEHQGDFNKNLKEWLYELNK